MCEKSPAGVPIMAKIYLLLAIGSSGIWLYNLDPAKVKRWVVIISLVAYVSHLPAVMILPWYSRPWVWSKAEWWRWGRVVLGWEEVGTHWFLEGMRPVVSLLLACAPFLLVSTSAGILGLAFEGFFVAEILKHTEAEGSFFMSQMAGAAFAAERAFGIAHPHWWTVFSVCLSLIALRSVLPFYEDLSTLLPEPYIPDDTAQATCAPTTSDNNILPV